MDKDSKARDSFENQISEDFSLDIFDSLTDSINIGSTTSASIQMADLQSAMQNYANLMNDFAKAKSTGLPVKTPSSSYKGFAAEEYFKNTLKINALSKRVQDYKIGVYTKGTLPDGTTLSGIDMETDISIWTRDKFWTAPKRTVDYQSKIYNNASKYNDAINNPQYKNVEFVGGSGQGVNDTVKVKINGKTITSDAITPQEATKLADKMKKQSTPEYDKKAEKTADLNKLNLGQAIRNGAIAGLIFSTTKEIIDIIKNGKELTEKQFVESIKNILEGTVEGGIRAGAIQGSIQLVESIIGKGIQGTYAAIPVMATANLSIDFAKDLYKCFITEDIDKDDLLCNSVNNAFSSLAGFSGGWTGGQLAGVALAKVSAAAGASIGSSIGPIGTIVGSVVGGVLIGIGANSIIGVASKDAVEVYNSCISRIYSNKELEFNERLFFFADEMGTLSDYC